MNTPFLNTNIYMYKYIRNPELVKYGYYDKKRIGVLFLDRNSDLLITDSTVNQINDLLRNERRLSDQDIIKLCRFIMCIESQGEYWIFGDKSEGIRTEDMDTLSILNNVYPGPKMIKSYSCLAMDFYCCSQNRGKIYNIVIEYNLSKKSIKVAKIDLGEYGRRSRVID
jgi:hypothetical protein